MSKPPTPTAPTSKPFPKRFYKTVTVAPLDEASAGRSACYRILLDGRPLRTPAKTEFSLPGRAIAEAIAQEWKAQDTHIDPTRMPLTRIANSTIDGVVARRAEVEEEIVKYACNDLVCYRAGAPEALVRRQGEAWDPVLAWATSWLGVTPRTGTGITPVAQPAELGPAVARALAGREPLQLAALHILTTLTGSALMALAHASGDFDGERIWQAAHVDEDFQSEQWGEDAEASRRRAWRHTEFLAACRMLALVAHDRANTIDNRA